jgi:hypothetical protein
MVLQLVVYSAGNLSCATEAEYVFVTARQNQAIIQELNTKDLLADNRGNNCFKPCEMARLFQLLQRRVMI